ncbi:MAG: molybdopterin-dependent oxidoreductase [Deltaproteobacteria bacterium]|nr:molybdopterin-dependent oxidoreductase [Deltaproteobacteria bacterium]
MNEEWKNGICGICPYNCGIKVKLENGRIQEIRGREDHIKGITCPRGKASADIVHSPDRLRHPLKRKGPKPGLDFEPISWEQALDEIAARILKLKNDYGPECIASFLGRGAFFEHGMVQMFRPAPRGGGATFTLFMPLGSPNAFTVGTLCFVSYGMLAPMTLFGRAMRTIQPDLENSDVIFIWGANPATDSPPITMRGLRDARRRGARIVVIDPLKTAPAHMAERWVPIRPGTDGALIHALARLCMEQGKVDLDFVKEFTLGYDQYRDYVRRFTPEAASAITWVEVGQIQELAEILTSTSRVSLLTFTGLEYSNSGVQSIRALLNLWALTGHLDVAGGLRILDFKPIPLKKPPINPPDHPKPIGYDRYPFFCDTTMAGHFMEFPRSVLDGDPYRIRFLLIGGASVLTGFPDTALFERSLAALDGLVVVDRFMTADAQYADYVLPATTYYENISYVQYPEVIPAPSHIQLRRRIVEPVGESRSDYLICAQLAERLGYGHLFPQTEEEMVRYIIGDLPLSMEDLAKADGPVRVGPGPIAGEERKWEKGMLRRDGRQGFNTPSGKWEIASNILKKYGHEPLPVYLDIHEGPENGELFVRFPLVFTSGARIQSTFRSQHLNIPRLLRIQPCARALIHPRDAAPRGISDGDAVKIISPRGWVTMRACVTEGIVAGVVEVNMGGGSPIQAEGWRDANVNLITDAANCDSISGFPVFKALLCQVEKVHQPIQAGEDPIL